VTLSTAGTRSGNNKFFGTKPAETFPEITRVDVWPRVEIDQEAFTGRASKRTANRSPGLLARQGRRCSCIRSCGPARHGDCLSGRSLTHLKPRSTPAGRYRSRSTPESRPRRPQACHHPASWLYCVGRGRPVSVASPGQLHSKSDRDCSIAQKVDSPSECTLR